MSCSVIGCSSTFPIILTIIFVNPLRNQISGLKIMLRNLIGLITKSEIDSLCCTARLFGVISPSIRIKKVIIPTEIPTAWLLNICNATIVAIAVAAMFTTLLPINIVVSIF